MNVAILGTGKQSQVMAYLIENGYNSILAEPLNVAAYVSGYPNPSVVDGRAVLNFEQFAAFWRKGLIQKIIFPREVFFEAQKWALTYLRQNEIEMSEVLVAARLNQKFYPLEKFERDFERLHEFIDDFGAIKILGGEPLLNPEVSEFVKVCRKLYPATPLHVVTNAILLPKMPDEFFDTVRSCNAEICISFYPPMESKMPAIHKLLVEKNVNHVISSKIEFFNWRQTLKRNNDPERMFKLCGYTNCHNLCDGKIAACFLPFVTKYFNAYYGKNLPEDGALDLYDPNLTTEKLKAHLLKPFERCRYCTPPVTVEWSTIKNPSPMTDWVHD